MNYNRKFVLLVMIPIVIESVVFLVIPVLGTIGISFTDFNPIAHTSNFIGFGNYYGMLDDPEFVIAFKNTFIFTFVAVVGDITIALTIAVLICQLNSNRAKSIFRLIVFLPSVAPMVVAAVVWSRSILSTNDGLVNNIIEYFGGEGQAWLGDPQFVMFSVIIFTLWAGVGYNVVLFSAGIESIPDDVYEAASLDGSGDWLKLKDITLPLLGRTTAFVLLMTMLEYFQMFAQFNVMLYQNGPQSSGLVLTSYIYDAAFKYKEMGYASAMSVILFLVVLIVTVIQMKATKVEWEY